jgi:hypothetical protein
MSYVLPTHTCFDDALDLIEAIVIENRREFKKLKLAHGICLMPDGEPYAHAWVEREGVCLFVGIIDGKRLTLAADHVEYYIDMKVQEVTHYTVAQAMAENKRSNHYGPWKPEYAALCGHKAHETRYLLTEDENGIPGILCKQCGKVSYHAKDVENRYCGHCHEFLAD